MDALHIVAQAAARLTSQIRKSNDNHHSLRCLEQGLHHLIDALEEDLNDDEQNQGLKDAVTQLGNLVCRYEKLTSTLILESRLKRFFRVNRVKRQIRRIVTDIDMLEKAFQVRALKRVISHQDETKIMLGMLIEGQHSDCEISCSLNVPQACPAIASRVKDSSDFPPPLPTYQPTTVAPLREIENLASTAPQSPTTHRSFFSRCYGGASTVLDPFVESCSRLGQSMTTGVEETLVAVGVTRASPITKAISGNEKNEAMQQRYQQEMELPVPSSSPCSPLPCSPSLSWPAHHEHEHEHTSSFGSESRAGFLWPAVVSIPFQGARNMFETVRQSYRSAFD